MPLGAESFQHLAVSDLDSGEDGAVVAVVLSLVVDFRALRNQVLDYFDVVRFDRQIERRDSIRMYEVDRRAHRLQLLQNSKVALESCDA